MVANAVRRTLAVLCGSVAAAGGSPAIAADSFSPAMKDLPAAAEASGPCTVAAREAMVAGPGHDHRLGAAHAQTCFAKRVGLVPLVDELAGVPGATLGELEVRGPVAVAAVAYPEAGFVLFDVSDPAHPEFRALYRSGVACSMPLAETDCGVDVELSRDGRQVYLGLKQDGLEPGDAPPYLMAPGTLPVVEVVDVSNPRAPALLQVVPAFSFGGATALEAFTVPAGPGPGRVPGDYLAVAASGVGPLLFEVGPGGLLTSVGSVTVDEVDRVVVREDPITRRTLMYATGGFDSGFIVLDVTNPADPVPVAEWDITPECRRDWYMHAIDVVVTGGRRIVAVAPLGADYLGEQDPGDRAQGCGTRNGNGDYAAPVFLVDATDFGRLGAATPVDSETAEEESGIKGRSTAVTVATWTNPAKRAAGGALFAPEELRFLDDRRLMVSSTHGGLVVLDPADGLAGRNVRPREIGAYQSATDPGRAAPTASRSPSFALRLGARPLVLDAVPAADGTVLATDAHGALHAVRFTAAGGGGALGGPGAGMGVGGDGGGASPRCRDRTAPASRFTVVRISRRAGIRLRGRSSDDGCSVPGRFVAGEVARVEVAIAREGARRRCRFVGHRGVRRCSRPVYLRARGTAKWSYTRKGRLRAGRYLVFVRATDAAGNRERARIRVNSRRLRIR